jgi:hypothetical protein
MTPPGAFDGCAEIQLQIVDRKTKILAPVAQYFSNLGVLEQGLGWDTPHVQTHTSKPLLVHDCDFLVKLCGADRSYIARRTSPDYNNIILQTYKLSPVSWARLSKNQNLYCQVRQENPKTPRRFRKAWRS